MTAKWQAGKTYAPGALVVPTSVPVQAIIAPTNPVFASGDLTGWTADQPSQWAVVDGGGFYVARTSGNGITQLANGARADIAVGQRVTVHAQIKITNAGTDDADAQVVLVWYADDGSVVGFVPGSEVNGKGGYWKDSTASGVAPAGTVAFGLTFSGNAGSHGSIIDWREGAFDYAVKQIPKGLVYKATQAAPGKSASTEPSWPGSLGVSVTDNQVTWEGVIASQIVWQASPIMQSGATEPTWPAAVGGVIKDGTGQWTALAPVITDSKCPHSTQVVIAAEKVFAGDEDVTKYSATANPLDWSTANDAGFIGHGQYSVQETSVTALGLYRGNIALFTASSVQLWKADPDPAAIVQLDAVESVGTSYPRGMAPVAQDLQFISPLGIRTVSVSASQQAMGEGDVGNPMDAIVRSLVGPDVTPLAAFFPNLGQSLFFFGDQVVVLFEHKLAKLSGWALYQLPISVTDVAVLDGDLYVRDATDIYWFQVGSKTDYGASFPVVLEWQYLDFGVPGTYKTFAALSMDADAVATVSAGTNVQVPSARTGKKRLARVSDAFTSFAFVGKQASFKLEFDSASMDSFTRLNVYFSNGGAR